MQDRDLYLSNNLTQSLTDVFTTIGETAQKTETPICFFIDEIQYMKQNQLGSLIAALHRTNQLGYPVMIVGAGLPKIYKMLSFADYKNNQCLKEANDVADPWYTGDFEATYRDIVAGCEGLLEYLGYR